MTNPDNVGGLLPCPGCGKSDLDHCPADFVAVNGLTRGMIVRCAWCHFAAPEAAWNRRELCRAAPAGSGEVSRLELAKMELAVTAALFNYEQGDTVSEWLKNTAALLRKLQQGAEYVMVPRQPTDAMRVAGERERLSHPGNINPLTTWDAMIAASQGQEGGHARD